MPSKDILSFCPKKTGSEREKGSFLRWKILFLLQKEKNHLNINVNCSSSSWWWCFVFVSILTRGWKKQANNILPVCLFWQCYASWCFSVILCFLSKEDERSFSSPFLNLFPFLFDIKSNKYRSCEEWIDNELERAAENEKRRGRKEQMIWHETT